MKTITNNEYFKFSNEEQSIFTGIMICDSSICYFKNGKIHREESKQCICVSDKGCLYPTSNGTCHGPAVINKGYIAWKVKGKIHNLNGPARFFLGGYKEYTKYGEMIYNIWTDEDGHHDDGHVSYIFDILEKYKIANRSGPYEKTSVDELEKYVTILLFVF